MAKSFSIKQRRQRKPTPITEEEVRVLDTEANAAYIAWKEAHEEELIRKIAWDRARHTYQAAIIRLNEQKKK